MRLVAVLVALALVPATADAAEIGCVDIDSPDCTAHHDTLDEALESKAPLIRLGPGPFEGTFKADYPVELAGSIGSRITTVDRDQPTLALTGGIVRVHNVLIDGTLRVSGDVTLADVSASDLALDDAKTVARNLSIAGAVTVEGGTLEVSSSVIGDADPFVVTDEAEVTTKYSAYAEDPDVEGPDRIDRDAPLVDTGDPSPLEPFEPFNDVLGETRITDGDGDSILRRDIGAFELQPTSVPMPGDSVLLNGGAEQSGFGWVGDFSAVGYGGYLLPTERTGISLGAGSSFFSGAGALHARFFQRVELFPDGFAIDAALGTATLSALVGGYGADTDDVSVEAVFKDLEAHPLGSLKLLPVTPAQRGNASNLVYRVASGPLPRRTRVVDVVLTGDRNAGNYTDAFVDNIALTMNVRGVPAAVPPPTPNTPVPGLRPFTGVTVLSSKPLVRAGRIRLGLACADATVGKCRGTIDVAAKLPGMTEATRIAPTTAFVVDAGKTASVRFPLFDTARAALRFRRALRATLGVITEDLQGLQRTAIVPVRLRLRSPR